MKILILTNLVNESFGRCINSTTKIVKINPDRIYIVHDSIAKNKFWGNSCYTAASYNFSKTNEFDLNIGRTNGWSLCGNIGCLYKLPSWGAGYGITTKAGQKSHFAKVFWEYSIFYFPPISAGLRADYIYDITNNTHYLKPSAGLSFFYIDIFYNYSLKLAGKNNIFKHGITLRIKYYHNPKKWKKNYY